MRNCAKNHRNSTHKKNRSKAKTQDGRFSALSSSLEIERLFAWLHNFRRWLRVGNHEITSSVWCNLHVLLPCGRGFYEIGVLDNTTCHYCTLGYRQPRT